jgi:hypothetical protein
MEPTRLFAIVSWILLPTVMFGGYSLLNLVARGNPWLTPVRRARFRAGHAHAGVLLAVSLVYYVYLGRTALSPGLRTAACVALLAGILAQSGGFFIDLAASEGRGRLTPGARVSVLGALLLAAAVLLLVYGLVVAP